MSKPAIKRREGTPKTTAREMLERGHWYKRGLEQWAFEITKENGRKVGVVRFSKQRSIAR
jgi:hypothetical protein